MDMNRRSLFGAVALTTVAAATVPARAALSRQPTDEEINFVRAIAVLHPNGKEAAIHALELGLDPADLYAVDLMGPGVWKEMPRLRFNRLDRDRHVWVSPIDVFHHRTGITHPREGRS
jgi:hypothetical protein